MGFVRISEGTGDNLLPEDRKNGYIDYINYEFLEYDSGELIESGGGMILLKEYYQDMFDSVNNLVKFLIHEEEIPDVNYLCLSSQ